MVSRKLLANQLNQTGHRFRIFGRTELKQLRRILNPGEIINQCVFGYYQGGSGLLVATDERVLLIDKRPFYLYVEDHDYASVSSVDFTSRLLQGVLYFQAGAKRIVFTSVSDARLAKLKSYIQGKIVIVDKTTTSTKVTSSYYRKPYQNPAWRPHHLTTRLNPRSIRQVPDTLPAQTRGLSPTGVTMTNSLTHIKRSPTLSIGNITLNSQLLHKLLFRPRLSKFYSSTASERKALNS